MRNLVLAIFSIILIFSACSPKVVEEVVEVAPAPKPVVQEPEERLTSCTTLMDLSPDLRVQTEDAFTLYRDQYKFEKYDRAVELWKKAFYNAPGANGKVTYHFTDGVQIYLKLFEKAPEIAKPGIADTIMAIYDMRMECFPDDGTTMAAKAFDGYYTLSQYVNQDEVFQMFKSVLDQKGDKADYFMINPFARMLYDRVLDKKIAITEASQIADQLFNTIDFGSANCKDKYCAAWEVIREYTPDLLSGLEGIKDFYDCDYYTKKYYPHYEANKEDCDNVSEVYFKMIWAGCDTSDAKFKEVRATKERVCYVAPPPPGPLRLAYDALERGEFTVAIQNFEEYVEKTEEPEKKADKLLLISKIYYAHIKNFPEARRYALKAAEMKPNWGDPYMLIGKLYASSGPLCGPGRGWDSQIVTWPAIDKFDYARKIDPNVRAEATDWINRYSKYMPSREDVFLRQLNRGDSFRVGCWIQENTSIRTAD